MQAQGSLEAASFPLSTSGPTVNRTLDHPLTSSPSSRHSQSPALLDTQWPRRDGIDHKPDPCAQRTSCYVCIDPCRHHQTRHTKARLGTLPDSFRALLTSGQRRTTSHPRPPTRIHHF
ncbi:unnamed protein product [Rhizoctonia solani]|uniref:Uncharacterized protein n=1 Tax=Rhizoctonia solani TaxID=456999 RepID=A0A8H3HL41_9AGAM|nr:unnamed protein product [Rhizoctonia solani]